MMGGLMFVLAVVICLLCGIPFVEDYSVYFVLLLALIAGGKKAGVVHRVIAWLVAAAAKFAVLYAIVVKIICGVLAPTLMEAGTLKEPMLKALPATFSWPQLFTALIGGAVALLIMPVLRKALHK